MNSIPRLRQIGITVALIIAATACLPSAAAEIPALPAISPLPTERLPTPVPYWPTAGWQSAPPETLGIDSRDLTGLYRGIRELNLYVRGVVVIRHGYLAAEGYYYPVQPEDPQYLFSGTKSVTSALIGIALAEGKLSGLDAKVLDYFPEYRIANLDERKQRMTLEHLLTMTSGLEWSESAPYKDDTLSKLMASQDWVQFILDQPMAHEPGQVFEYNSGNSHLLSAILQRATGKTLQEYAREKLFQPLEITTDRWDTDPQGISIGGWGLWLTPREMAKFGYLYLHQGDWNGSPIIPADWISASLSSPVPPQEGLPQHYGYGYHWWLTPQISKQAFAAIGYLGQWIFVIPEEDLVVVFVGREGRYDLTRFVRNTLLPGTFSTPLPANPEAHAALQAMLADINAPVP